MARPISSAKQSVDLAPNPAPNPASNPASSAPRVSRIRRDPPPAVKPDKIDVSDPEERDQRAVIVGILVFALAICVIVIAFGRYTTWSPREYTIEVNSTV